ncbi:MAG TPA: M28 family peptidase, partial [Anaerolineae bacterium]|nr:M28 family peptidase [Anaerolineae bacterium]
MTKRNIALSLFLLFLILIGMQAAIVQAQPPHPPVLQEGPADGEQDLALRRDPQREARTAAALPSAVTPNPLVQQMIDQVDADTVYSMTGELTGEWAAIVGGSPYTITNRNTYGGDPIQHATQYVYEHFQADGLDASYHVWNGAGYPNVVGEITGLGRPDDIWLITAHLDDMPTNPIAPGADDNASGSTGVLLAAQIFGQYAWDCTLRFVTFTGEEQGLLGSDAYAQMAADNGDNILGVINLDMIAYNSDAYPILELHTRSGNTGDLAIANLFADVVDAYGLDLTPEIVQDGISASDHYSFWLRGYSAILAIEDFQDFTPYYHTVNDRLSTLDLDYYTEFIRAAVGTLAHTGCLLQDVGSLDGTVTDLSSGLPLSATITAQGSLAAIETTSDVSGYYTLTLPVDTYTLTAQAHLYGYYSATVTDVVVLTDTVTHQDLALDPYPTYVISGAVSETVTGAPLSATIETVACPDDECQAHIYAAASTDPVSGYYSLTLISGTYTLRVNAEGYRPLTRTVTVDRDQSQDFELAPQDCVLLVDDDGGDDAQAAYRAALEALNIEYATWTVEAQGTPTTSLMEQYRHVIWLTGDRYVNTLTSADRTALSAYLDGGGRLFLSGWGVGSDLDGTAFLSEYLHADYAGDGPWGSTEPLTGGGFLAGLPVSITIPVAQPA